MSSSEHHRLSELFLNALEQPETERAAFLDDACGGDVGLREEVDAMLKADAGSGDRLETPVASVELGALVQVPEAIGGYRVLSVLGEGGMGTVYKAEQHSPERTVAVKVLHWNANREALKRFEHEAQVLGWLQHPNVAQVFEAGVEDTDVGGGRVARPFFAMEWIDGLPIDDYAKELRLDLEARLHLIVRVAEGVQHAHQKGVIHRDLKPGNILVQDDGEPKILDFGVARAVAAEGKRDGTLLTRVGEVVGTLAYMSSEQVRADPAHVDTRADVYSLGVLAYELLSGRRPIETGGVALQEGMRRVLEEEPPPLGSVCADVPDDVATIVHKAMAKDKERRYVSMEAFAADVRRFLRREPILARPPSRVYYVQRFVQRNRAATLGICATALALLGGVAASTWSLRRERAAVEELRSTQVTLEASLVETQSARDQAEQRRAEAADRLELLGRTNRYFEQLLSAPLPGQDGHDVRLFDVLKRAAAEGAVAFDDSPRQAAWLAATLAQSFSGLQLADEALEQVAVARAALEQLEPVDPLQRAHLARIAGVALGLQRRDENAEAEFAGGLALLEGDASIAAEHMRYQLYTSLHELRARSRDFDGSLTALDLSEAALVRVDGTDAEQQPKLLAARGSLALRSGDVQAGTELTQRALTGFEALGQERTLDVALLRNTLAAAYSNAGRIDEAVAEMEQALQLTRELVGDDHEFVAIQSANLATLCRHKRRFDDSETYYTVAIEIGERIFDGPHPTHATHLSSRGSLRIGQGNYEEGEADLLEAIALLKTLQGGEAALARAFAMSYRAPVLRHDGDLDGADELIEAALDLKKRVIGRELHPQYEIDLRERTQNANARGDWLLLATRETELAEFFLAVRGPGNRSTGLAVERARSALEKTADDDTDSTAAALELQSRLASIDG